MVQAATRFGRRFFQICKCWPKKAYIDSFGALFHCIDALWCGWYDGMIHLQRFHRREEKSPFPSQCRSQKSEKKCVFQWIQKSPLQTSRRNLSNTTYLFLGLKPFVNSRDGRPITFFQCNDSCLDDFNSWHGEDWKLEMICEKLMKSTISFLHTVSLSPPPRWKYSITVHT